MKVFMKLGLLFGFAVLLALPVKAASPISQNLLGPNVYSVIVSNATMGVTNLASQWDLVAGNRVVSTNQSPLLYTNIAPYVYQGSNTIPGNLIVVVLTNITATGSATNTTSIGDSVYSPILAGVQASERNRENLLGEATLYADGQGYPISAGLAMTNVVTNYANASITIELWTVNAAANSAVTFRFNYIGDGIHENTTAAGDFTCSFTPTALTGARQCKTFPVPLIYPGIRKIRLTSIDNADTDANSAVWVTAATLNTWH